MYYRLNCPHIITTRPEFSYDGKEITVNTGGETLNIAFYDLSTEKSYCYWGNSASYIPADEGILTKLPNVRICLYGPTTISYFAEIKNGAVVSTEDSNKRIKLSCENSGSATISIALSGNVEELKNPTIEVTDLAGYTTVSVPVAKECYSTEVMTDGPGNYSVTLIDEGNIIETIKIQIR